jgi:hypothetical protein
MPQKAPNGDREQRPRPSVHEVRRLLAGGSAWSQSCAGMGRPDG